MPDYEVAIIGAGPAGLSAAIYLGRSRRSVVLIGEKIFDSQVANLEAVENYPGFGEPVIGSTLIAEMINQVMKNNVPLEQTTVSGIEPIAGGYQVINSNGTEIKAKILIIASGTVHRKLGIPGEELLQGKGVFQCALCDGGEFAGQDVVVCGGGDAGVTECLYMTKIASKVILVEALPSLTASAILKERLEANDKIEVLCGTKVTSIIGRERVEGIEILDPAGKPGRISASGVLVDIGLLPNTQFLKGMIPLDGTGHILVNARMETEVKNILAAGDVRSGSPNQIVTATGDGATAAITAGKLLQEMG
jgi:thioredoxin reductase (NADPH)